MNPDEQKPAIAPVITEAPQPIAPAPVAASSGKKFNKNMLIGSIVGAVVLAGGIGWAVYAAISNSPDNLMKTAMHNLVTEKQLAGTLKIEAGTAGANTSMTGNFAVAVDPNNDKNSQVIFGLGNGDKRFAASGLVLDKNIYLKLSNAENLSTIFGAAEPSTSAEVFATPQIATMLKNINDQWFELSEQDVKSLAGNSGTTSGAAVAGASPEDLKRVMEIYSQHSFIKADQVFADEIVDDTSSAHFSLRLDRDQYIKFMQAVKDANLATIKITDKDIEDAKKEQERPIDGSIEVWIARDSKKFKQLRAVNAKKGEEMAMTLTVSGAIPTFEKYEKPAGTKSISELMTVLLGPSISPVELDALQNSQSSELYLTQ